MKWYKYLSDKEKLLGLRATLYNENVGTRNQN